MPTLRVARPALIRDACFRGNEKHFSQATGIRNASVERALRLAALGFRCVPQRSSPGGQRPHPGGELRTKLRRGSVRVYARRNPISGIVDARGNPVAAIGFHGRAAAAESCEE